MLAAPVWQLELDPQNWKKRTDSTKLSFTHISTHHAHIHTIMIPQIFNKVSIKLIRQIQPSETVHACNPSGWEAESGGLEI